MRHSASIVEHAAIAEENETLFIQKKVEEMNECLTEPTRDLLADFLLIQQSNISLQKANNRLRQTTNAIGGG